MLLAPACVGPSRTAGDYERKVANTAEAVISAAESALLTVEVVADGRAPAPYVSLRLSESEETVGSVESSFGAVQPPDPDLDALRAETLAAVGDVGDVVEELRLAAYRAEFDRLPGIAKKLREPLSHLDRLMRIAPT